MTEPGEAIPFRAIREERPGPAWFALFEEAWPAYERWFLSEGDAARPSLERGRAELARHMPELFPTYRELVALVGGRELVARFLAHYRPTPYLSGCSQVVWSRPEPFLVRNYDYHPDLWEASLCYTAWNGTRVIAMSECLWGVLDGMNEHGLCVGLHQVSQAAARPGLVCILIVRVVLDQCATTREAVALLRRIPHGLSFNYSLMDAGGHAAVVEASPAAVVVREGKELCCSNHFLSPTQQAFNRRNPGSYRHLPVLERFSRERLPADRLFRALNDSLSAVFDHRYTTGSGTLHTIVCTPAERRMQVGVGGDARPCSIDFATWVAGGPLGLQALEGQLGGTAKPFDPGRRVFAKAAGGTAKVFIGTPLDNALFKDLTLANASFANVSLAGARFDDVDFSNTVITSNCNFNGMQIAGVSVKELLASHARRQTAERDR